MKTNAFSYFAQRFHPRNSEQALLLFVAPAGEITTWAGVPRKAFNYMRGFQRTLQSERVADVSKFYNEDVRNISPTAVVIGLGPSVTIREAKAPGLDGIDWVEVKVSAPDYASMPMAELAKQAITELEWRLGPEVVTQIRERSAEAVVEATELEAADTVDQATGAESDSLEQLSILDRSYLEDFYAQLLGYVSEDVPWPADETPLREVFYSLLKPAIIVDGQHRIFGAADLDPAMLLGVCAIPGSNWSENVYQFVVINQKAKPIKPAFLSSIIATSLSQNELETVYNRLQTSAVNVERSAIMDQVNSDAVSPFRGMIDFEVERGMGFLSFPGMWRLASDFRNIEQTHAALLPNGSWDGVSGSWMDHFFAFWSGIRDYFGEQDPRLWREPTPSNPNNLLKIVALQEIQGMMLDVWTDARTPKLTTPDATRERASDFWAAFPSEFFTDEWKIKGLQTKFGRDILREAMLDTRRNSGKKNWGHRRLGLFKGSPTG